MLAAASCSDMGSEAAEKLATRATGERWAFFERARRGVAQALSSLESALRLADAVHDAERDQHRGDAEHDREQPVALDRGPDRADGADRDAEEVQAASRVNACEQIARHAVFESTPVESVAPLRHPHVSERVSPPSIEMRLPLT